MTTISIIGTAGRKEDGEKLSKSVYEKMYLAAKKIVHEFTDPQLVSGGAAWGDHLAVSLFLAKEVKKLTLHFPCEFNSRVSKFAEAGFRSSGGTANYYHRLFSQKMAGNDTATLHGIQKALLAGAESTISTGFLARNKLVAKSDVILAFTFGESGPKDGGTKHTWDHARKAKRIHVPISFL